MWKTTNYLGKEVVWYSKEEVQEIFSNITNLCNNVIFQTNETNQLKEEILRILSKIKEENELN